VSHSTLGCAVFKANSVGVHEIVVDPPRHDRSLHELEIDELYDVIRAFDARIGDSQESRRRSRCAHDWSFNLADDGSDVGNTALLRQSLLLFATPSHRGNGASAAVRTNKELKDRWLIIAESDDFATRAPFASRFPFELGLFPKFRNSAFSRISPTQI